MTSEQEKWLDLETASQLIAQREIRVSELVEFMLARIERLNPKVNAYIAVLADTARAQAAIADKEILAGRWRGKLHGITFAVKDLINVQGVETLGGSRTLNGNIAGSDAHVVERLREAGAILLGKLHTHELAGGATSENELHGRVRNPWNADYIPGGSSGGSAAAAAAGLAHITLGTDTGGSVRMPAAFCGVVGLKGTFGRVSRRGVLTRSWSMDHIGVLTPRVRDSALLFQAIAGYDPQDPYSSDRLAPDLMAAIEEDIRGLRIGVLHGAFFEQALDPRIGHAFGNAVDVLQSAGAGVSPVEFRLAEAAHVAGTIITIAEAASSQDEAMRRAPDQFGADIRDQLRLAEFISARQYLRALRVRGAVQQELGELLREFDILLSPTTTVMPIRAVGEVSPENLTRFAHNTRPFSLPGLPAVSVPAGFTDDGMPIGLQLIARPFDECTLMRAARAYERETAWHERRPLLWA
jgi:aspartyl-tRNA(Asn)/glutamyl-tRNA(Gln) amidotransferase subunit A